MSNLKKNGEKRKSRPRSYLVIGCGHFGSRAVFELLRKDPSSKIIVVDKSRKALQKVAHLPVEPVVSDALQYMNRIIFTTSAMTTKRVIPAKAGLALFRALPSHGGIQKTTGFPRIKSGAGLVKPGMTDWERPISSWTGYDSVNYVIPAVPFHLAFEFILSHLKPLGARREKVPALPELPNPMEGKNGDLYTSFASFLCPEDCSEPSGYCTVTKKNRAKPLYQILRNLQGPFASRVIRSEQLGPGVGGLKTEVLLELANEIRKRRAGGQPILIGTACRCHGVLSCLSFD